MKKIALLGCPGAGKGSTAKPLIHALGGGFTISVSEDILKGGRSDGNLDPDDFGVHAKIFQYLVETGFFSAHNGENYIFDGVCRNDKQVKLFVRMLAEHGLLDENIIFLHLPVSDACALFRMQNRYFNNLQNGTLRNDEMGTAEEVDARFRKRISDWRMNWPGIKSTIMREIRGYEAQLIEVDGSGSIDEVVMNILGRIEYRGSALESIDQYDGRFAHQ